MEIAAILTQIGTSRSAVHSEVIGDFATLSLDHTNAFNSIRRRFIIEGLQAYAPTLIPFFMWVYGQDITLRWGEGHPIGYSATGVLQGDPLASLYFGVGIHHVLLRLQDTLREKEVALWREEQGLGGDDEPTVAQQIALQSTLGPTVAIADDISISGRTSVVFQMAGVARTAFEHLGLQLNLGKS